MATITTLQTTETGADSRVIINTNFTNLNTEVSTATSDITALEATVNTGALAGTSGTPSGTNKFVTNDDTTAVPTANKVARYDSSGLLSGVPPQITDKSYPAGETLSVGNVVFIEPAPTTAQATSAQNIGDVTANTRVSFPVFGSGSAASTIKLNLAKTGSPSVNVNVRIETDNGSGNPSGTLVNANATGTVAAASISTDAFGVDQTLDAGKTSSGTGSTTSQLGVTFVCNLNNISFTSVTKQSVTSPTRARLMDSSESTTYATATFVGDVATFTPYALTKGVTYKVIMDNNGSSYTFCNLSGGSAYPFVGIDANITADNGLYKSLSFIVNAPTNTVTLGGSITIPAGQKCHAVVYQGTYGSETVNASNYYKIGYYTNDTSTRGGRFWNGSAWSVGTGIFADELTGFTSPASQTSYTASDGYRILANKNCNLLTVTKEASAGATRCRVFTDAGTLVSTASFSGNVATFSPEVALTSGQYYRVEADNSGSSYTTRYFVTGNYPVSGENITYNTGSSNQSNTVGKNNIVSMTTVASNAKSFPYTSSTLFSDKVLSKTDADFAYKLDWLGISQEAVTAGDLTTGKYPTIALEGVDSNQTGMTQGTTMYLSNTAGGIASSAGTIPKTIGEAITASKLQIGEITGGKVLLFTRDNTAASGTVTYTHNLGRIPKLFNFDCIYATNQWSKGAYDGVTQSYIYPTGTPGVSSGTGVIQTTITAGTSQTATISNVNSATFDLVWTKNGSPTGSVSILATLI